MRYYWNRNEINDIQWYLNWNSVIRNIISTNFIDYRSQHIRLNTRFSVFRSTGLSATIVENTDVYQSPKLVTTCPRGRPQFFATQWHYCWLIVDPSRVRIVFPEGALCPLIITGWYPHDHCSTPRSEMADHHCPPLLANSIVFDGSTIMLVKSQSWVLNPILRPPSIRIAIIFYGLLYYVIHCLWLKSFCWGQPEIIVVFHVKTHCVVVRSHVFGGSIPTFHDEILTVDGLKMFKAAIFSR